MTFKFQKLEEDYIALLAEFNKTKCKLDCKTDSLLILSHELEQYRSEKDQYKLMADQLRERYSALKRRVEGWGPSLMGVYDVDGLKCEREKSLVQLLCELKEHNKSLRSEKEDLRQRLEDSQGDIKILREEISKQNADLITYQMPCDVASISEKEVLVKQMEALKYKCLQLTQDLESILDEKEELVTARDQYRHKFERLNEQMNYLLRGDQQKLVDIDGVIMENRYLRERIQQIEEEKAVAHSALDKCRVLLEKKRSKSSMRNSLASGLIISAKQVEQLLQNTPFLDLNSKSKNVVEFRNLIITLLENLNDKSIALSHQRKTNKILGNRISELEERIKSMEVSTLCHVPDPSQFSFLLHSSDSGDMSNLKLGSALLSDSENLEQKSADPIKNPNKPSIQSGNENSVSEFNTDLRTNSGFSDLDILPTRDFPFKGSYMDRPGSISSCSYYSDSKLSSETTSPIHTFRTLHSDSEITPKHSPACKDRHQWSLLDMEDLPLKLQQCIANALSGVEGNSEHEAIVKSPQRKKMGIESQASDPGC